MRAVDILDKKYINQENEGKMAMADTVAEAIVHLATCFSNFTDSSKAEQS